MTSRKSKKDKTEALPAVVSDGQAAKLELTPEEEAAKEQLRARAIARGSYVSAHVAERFGKSLFAGFSLDDMAYAVADVSKAVLSGDMTGIERILTGQVIALHAIFADLATRAKNCDWINQTEVNMRLALKAQAQCARTAEVLGNLRSGPTVFAKQANITSGPQQVNNGVPSVPARAQETSEPTNELLEGNNGQRLDTGAAGTPGRIDRQLAPVGSINRPEDCSGKESRRSQRPKARDEVKGPPRARAARARTATEMC